MSGLEMTAILFDIDGTLLDHDGAERASAKALHRATGVTLPVEEFLSRWSFALEREFARYLDGKITYQAQGRARVRAVIDPALADDAADQIYAQYIAGYEDAWSLFPDVLPCLDMLADHRLGVISNGLTSEQRKKLVKTGIDGRFEFILISEACGWAKPSSEIFHYACAAMGESPSNVTYVGNHYDLDACAARQSGLTGVWIDRCGLATERHLHPIITKLDQLPALLKSCRSQCG
jgi:putative hydrolase of the HAD superfamily